MKPKRKRLALVVVGLVILGGAAALVLNAFQENIVFFVSPSDLTAQASGRAQALRLGGLVEQGSVVRGPGTEVHFKVTDLKRDVAVSYDGILPDLFREGQGVVAEGKLQPDGSFLATTVLAKHDEKYMPPEVAAALKKSGHWQDEEQKRYGETAAGVPAGGRAP
ncbi:MAG TPA: cytochrome c maturation protein CcmE [Alphaproteobacteria bacterium]|nr:cytochrome c maturation protein CcmE [Alphaproteobacteria bacterium]